MQLDMSTSRKIFSKLKTSSKAVLKAVRISHTFAVQVVIRTSFATAVCSIHITKTAGGIIRRRVRYLEWRLRRYQKLENSPFLSLPAELRTEVYSYLLPGVERTEVSQALRRTCRQINDEVQYEIRQKFERQWSKFQEFVAQGTDMISVYEAPAPDIYHVHFDLGFIRLYDNPPTANDKYRRTKYIKGLLSRYIKQLPVSTKSVILTLEMSHPADPLEIQRYFCDVGQIGLQFLPRAKKRYEAGELSLREIIVLVNAPVVFGMTVYRGDSELWFPGVNIQGAGYWYDKRDLFQVGWVFADNQRCKHLANEAMAVLERCGVRLHFRCKHGPFE